MNPNYKEGLDFFIINIELANPSPLSICQFAITEIKNGLLHKIVHAYVDPESDDFSYTRYHGISSAMIEGKQVLEKYWDRISSLLADRYVAAHNMDVVYNAFRLYAEKNGLHMPEFKMLDTNLLSELLGLGNKELKALADYYSIDYVQHDAVAEGKAIAVAILKYCRAKNISDPYILYGNIGTIPHKIDDSDQLNKYEVAGSQLETEVDIEKVDIKGKLFVFTGELAKFERKYGVDKITSRGGEIKNNVTLKTDYVVIGDNMEHKTAVLTTAEKYIEERGLPIKIINEEQFLTLVD